MHLAICISALLAVIGGASASPPPDITPEAASPIQTADLVHVPQQVNNMPTEQDALLSYLFGWNSTAPQSNIARATLRDGNDIVPIQELPPCYHKCMVDNCCNMAWDGARDIREMTTDDFCIYKFVAVKEWFLFHVQWCVRDVCAGCLDEWCRHAAQDWFKRVCGYWE
ncbi:hypothetical protein DL767_003271 [Monosporascus sp. MG133]|nr:hypothetical protein DL767_003271 [Monosporascus sp. MG133]